MAYSIPIAALLTPNTQEEFPPPHPDTMPHVMTLPTRQESLDAALLPEILELYFEAKRAEIAPRTLHSYRNQLAPFLAFWEQQADFHQHRLSQDVLAEAVRWIRSDYRNSRGTPAAPHSVADCIVRMKQFFKWAYQNNCTGPIDLTKWTPARKHVEGRLYFPDVEEMRRLFAAPSGLDRIRDLALFAFLLSTGARLFETARACAGHVEWAGRFESMRVGDDHRGAIWLQHVKGDREGEGAGRYCAFCSAAGLMLKCYLRSAAPPDGSTLFGISDSGISQIVKRHALTARLPELSPHAFRRMFADWWDETHGIAGRLVLKRQLGHSLRGQDVTENHYISSKNPRRVIAELLKWHTSPVEHLLDWRTLPVHIDPDCEDSNQRANNF